MTIAAYGKLASLHSTPITENEKSSEETIQSAEEAIQNGSLATYLAHIDPKNLAKKLAQNWKKAPYLDILKICNAVFANSLLVELTANNMMCKSSRTKHSLAALKIFNTPERLPVFIEVLKIARERLDTLNIDDLLIRDRDPKATNLFYKGLPSFVRQALLIEHNHGFYRIEEYIDKSIEEEKKCEPETNIDSLYNDEYTDEELNLLRDQIINEPYLHAEFEYMALIQDCGKLAPLQS